VRRGIPNYDESEVEALIASYHDLRAGIEYDRSGRRVARVVARLADLDKAVARLPLDYLEVVVMHGLLGIPQENAARLLEIKPHTVGKRFRRAVEEITYLMNGGI
jgi:DNA-directed RNA polymerase specialized sigma24 family protein